MASGRRHALAGVRWPWQESQQWESNPQPPHYECGALPIEAMLACWSVHKARSAREGMRGLARGRLSLASGPGLLGGWSGLENP